MYENWLADRNDQAELAKNHAYLLASFWNPEAVKKMIGDDGGSFVSTPEEFEESWDMVKEMNKDKAPKNEKGRRKRRRVIG